ncbi:hypothetical protein MBANPS3_012513 [Mucor bainieri]
MKLRDRTKRILALGNIKQEDRKPALTIAERTTSIPTNTTNTDELTVKQEDTKEDESMFKQHGEFSERDYYYRCDMCEMKMTDLKSVLEHRKSTHQIKTSDSRTIKHMNTEPDIHDANFYCKSCERSYKNRDKYRHHLRHVHYMILKPIPYWKAPRNDMVPDPDDPNSYCRACDHTYRRKSYYKQHCRYVHGMKHVKVTSQSSTTSSSLMDTYCQVCDKRFASLDYYREHLFVIHKVDWRTLQRKRKKDISPNVSDLNFYCRSCEKKLSTKYSYKNHLMLVHSIFQSAPRKKSKLKPGVNDPNNYCRACQKTYPSKGRYREHLRLAHQMTLPLLKGNISRTDLPDPYNSSHYCSVCMKTYATLAAYRYHCRRVHFMTLSHASIVNSDAEININDPDLYCAQCEHTFTDKSGFRRHLRAVHSI